MRPWPTSVEIVATCKAFLHIAHFKPRSFSVGRFEYGSRNSLRFTCSSRPLSPGAPGPLPLPSIPNSPDEIHCNGTHMECSPRVEKVKLPFQTNPPENGFTGYLLGYLQQMFSPERRTFVTLQIITSLLAMRRQRWAPASYYDS